MSKKNTTIITVSILLLALATPCVWLGMVNRQKKLDRALFEAAEHGTGEDVRRAVANGGRTTAQIQEIEPIWVSVPILCKNKKICDMFGSMGIVINDPKSGISLISHGPQVIHMSTMNPDVSALDALLAIGIPADAFDYDHDQPIHYAARWGNIKAIRRLLDAGAKIDAVGNSRKSPLHCAINGYMKGERKMETINVLITYGAKAASKDSIGRTPADLARKHGEWAEERSFYLALAAYLDSVAAREQPPPLPPQ